jgi:hypothetical protein
VFAFRVPVNVGNRAQARVALGVHETQVFPDWTTTPCLAIRRSEKKTG